MAYTYGSTAWLQDYNSPERGAAIRAERAKERKDLAESIQGTFKERAALDKTIHGTWDEKSALQKWQTMLDAELKREGLQIQREDVGLRRFGITEMSRLQEAHNALQREIEGLGEVPYSKEGNRTIYSRAAAQEAANKAGELGIVKKMLPFQMASKYGYSPLQMWRYDMAKPAETEEMLTGLEMTRSDRLAKLLAPSHSASTPATKSIVERERELYGTPSSNYLNMFSGGM